MHFGIYFRRLRKEKNVTQKQVADIIAKNPMLISNIENGKNGPFSDSDLKKIVTQLQKMRKGSCIRRRQKNEEGFQRKCKIILLKMTRRIICSMYLLKMSLVKSLY